MKQIATFFTCFWIVYFPTCIAFNELPSLGLVDEFMTIVLVAFTLSKLHHSSVVKYPIQESKIYILIISFFIIYGLIFGANVQAAVWRDMVQWVRPFSVIYCTWILNPQFSDRQKKTMLYCMIITIFAWLLYHPEVRFGVDTEFVVLGQLAVCTGMAWYLMSSSKRKNKYIAIALVMTGLFAPKFKYLGEVVCVIYVLFFLKKKFNFRSLKTIGTLCLVVAVVLYVTWFKFDVYYVSGMDSEELARPMTYRIAFTQILWDYFPFGSGMGSWGCAAAADYYSPLLYKYHMNKVWGCTPDLPMFVADAFYPTLCQLGVVGIFFFCVFWKRRLVAFNKIQDMRYYRVAWITFFCLAIEQTADTSFLSGKGMGYCMLIGLCLNANRNMGVGLNAVDDSAESEDEKLEDNHKSPRRRRGLFRLGHNFKANRWRKDRENV